MSKNTNQLLINLVIFLQTADKAEFIKVWGETLGEHFWEKGINKNSADLLFYISNQNLIKLEKYLLTKTWRR